MRSARAIVATLWDSNRVLRTVGLSEDEQQASVDAMDDKEIEASLRKLGVAPIPDTPEERRARLRSWPGPEDLDQMATALVAENDGVKPVVRVLSRTFARPGGAPPGVPS